ncbi:poly polymerase and DNA-ligase Zn-finger region-domain-containing protein [Aspergillus avenaceus]|uniref:Poly polymerase and DNA-ligase Zn-finger region-domain-containing protein n=1 Tax=Aspergillus avenaceus TaxID=36643 RepID=A0A5N6TN11_ASPAV|nr:poly polymerase and DNA-ligase Zn-finger region-domain-containing protein [Aspergillus avenaceus]
MPSYRLEEASTGRAGCQNKECKDAKVKIAKGELRHGTWVDTERIQAFMWRHWGCVTPKLITNINENIESDGDKDFDQLDGFEDLSSENQEKVKRALEQGHVDDDEWKGDVEMNRPGMTGFRKRASKKKGAAAEDDEAEQESPEPKTKKRGRQPAKKEANEAEEAPEPKKPKKGLKGKQSSEENKKQKENEKAGSDDDAAAQTKPKPARRGRPSKEASEAKASAKAPAKATKPPAKRQQKAPANEEEAAPAEEKPKRGRRKKASD